ncbi:dihydrofolate reductase [Flavobacterium caeni]|uniref:Dihydrofolate reductase n=1 Tax=Flavobacterium caeni TaxID=490189 RepID=A0A1G5GLQ2_9FLAO|nr:dihydrofolate reductase [Flavobacterium caeni]SCY52259.1 dihydrofolate reductase [Flavobacterium caeni]
MVILIAAVAQNNGLGKDNRMIWHLPDDFKRFKKLTTGHHIVMGRKTFESLPGLLPNRTHVVISRQKDYRPEGAIVAHSLEKALQIPPKDQDIYIIGGGEIYRQALPYANKLEITRVYASFEADAFFPEIGPEWKLVAEEPHGIDDKHAWAFTFETYVK